MTETPQSVSDYLASIGGKGGLARTEKKKKAGQRNAAKAREAKAAKRLRPMDKTTQATLVAGDSDAQVVAAYAGETRHKSAGASWEGAVSLRDVQKAAKAQKAAGREGDPSESGLRIQTTGRKR